MSLFVDPVAQFEGIGHWIPLHYHEGANNPVLGRMMESIMPLLSEGRKQTNTLPNMRTKASNYHVLIAIAIEEREPEQARLLMQAHINGMLQTLNK